MATYLLWDMRQRVAVAEYPNEDEALADVAQLLDVNGPTATDALSLISVPDDATFVVLASGDALAARVRSR